MQLLRAPDRHRARARVRGRLSDAGDPGRRPERSRLRRSRRSSNASRRGAPSRKRRRCRSSSTKARTRRRSIRSPPDGPKAGSSCGASSGRVSRHVTPAIRTRNNPRRRRCSRTTFRTACRGTGASASTPGPKGIAAGAYLVRCSARAARLARADELALAVGERRSSPASFSRSPDVMLDLGPRTPERFYCIFTRPQWRSWLVRGAFIISRLRAGARAALRCRACGLDRATLQKWLADRWHSARGPDGGLHRVSVRPGEGARPLAEPAAAAALARSGAAAGLGGHASLGAIGSPRRAIASLEWLARRLTQLGSSC